ncbi:Vitamin B12 import ATP-binding protein BtuD [compost metagenome]
MRQPRLLILDEATCALDLRHQLTVLGLLRDYVCTSGALILMAVHDLNLAARTTDRLLLLQAGKVAACGSPATVLTAPTLGMVYGIDVEVVAGGRDIPFVVPIAPRPSRAA